MTGRPRARIAASLLAVVAVAAWSGGRVAHGAGAALSGIVDLDYQHGFDDAPVSNAVTTEVRVRALVGERLAACLGIDGQAGIGGGGALYRAALYPLGLAVRYGRTSHVALCGGVGLAGVSGGAVPFSFSLPLELHWEGTGAFRVGRPLAVVRVSRALGPGDRAEGTRLIPAADELQAVLGLRVMLPGEVVPGLAFADGIYLGLTYGEALGARTLGVAIGYAVAAHH